MVSVILMMAGNSSRMNTTEKKVYLPLGNKLVFEHSLDLFLNYHFEIICVIKEEDKHYLDNYLTKVKYVYGGNTRQESVYNGLKVATGDFVLIHDAARPLVSKRIIDECLVAIKEKKAFLVTVPSKDSLYNKSPLKSVPRDNITLAQTPQGGNLKNLLIAHEKAIQEQFMATDDISLLLKYCSDSVKLIAGDENNFKITTQLDYILAKELIKNV